MPRFIAPNARCVRCGHTLAEHGLNILSEEKDLGPFRTACQAIVGFFCLICQRVSIEARIVHDGDGTTPTHTKYCEVCGAPVESASCDCQQFLPEEVG